MSYYGDYPGEMRNEEITDSEIEDLLSGSPDTSDALAPIADFFEALRSEPGPEIDEGTIAGFVAAAVDASNATFGATTTSPVRPRSRSLLVSMRRRAAAIAVAATVLFGGTSGLALAADGAKPGDALYGIDRAFEGLGIGAGDAEERFSEANALIDAGEVPRGLQHAAEAVEKHSADGPTASEALKDAADRVRAGGAEPSAATREGVAGLLTYISENVGDLDGRQVAELAREIGSQGNRPATPPGSSKPDAPGPPDHSPADPPGRSDEAPAPPGHARSDSPGNSESAPGLANKPPKNKP